MKSEARWGWILLKLVCQAKNLNFILKAWETREGILNVRSNHSFYNYLLSGKYYTYSLLD